MQHEGIDPVTDDPTPTTARRQLGARLRQLRQDQGKTAQQLADVLGVSGSKLSRLESGARAVSPQDMAGMIEFFGLPPEQADELQLLARLGRRRRVPAPQPAAADADDVFIKQSGFLDLERDSDWIREFNGGVVPGLLQTPSYMRAAIVEGSLGIEGPVVESTMDLRLRRQRGLRADRLYEVLVDESVLLRCVGNAQVMAEQLEAIADAITAKALSFRVVPLSAGAHPGVNSMFVALRVRDDLAPNIVFSEGLGGHLKFERPEDVDRFDRVWTHLESLAERSESTVERLRYLIDLYRAR